MDSHFPKIVSWFVGARRCQVRETSHLTVRRRAHSSSRLDLRRSSTRTTRTTRETATQHRQLVLGWLSQTWRALPCAAPAEGVRWLIVVFTRSHGQAGVGDVRNSRKLESPGGPADQLSTHPGTIPPHPPIQWARRVRTRMSGRGEGGRGAGMAGYGGTARHASARTRLVHGWDTGVESERTPTPRGHTLRVASPATDQRLTA